MPTDSVLLTIQAGSVVAFVTVEAPPGAVSTRTLGLMADLAFDPHAASTLLHVPISRVERPTRTSALLGSGPPPPPPGESSEPPAHTPTPAGAPPLDRGVDGGTEGERGGKARGGFSAIIAVGATCATLTTLVVIGIMIHRRRRQNRAVKGGAHGGGGKRGRGVTTTTGSGIGFKTMAGGDAGSGEPTVSFRADAHMPPDAPPGPPPLPRAASSLVERARMSLTQLHSASKSYSKFDEADVGGLVLVDMQAQQAARVSEKSGLVDGEENRDAVQ